MQLCSVFSKSPVNMLSSFHAAAAAAKSPQPCPTLCNPIDGRPPGSSVQRVLLARILECVANSFFKGSYQPRDQTYISCITGSYLFIYFFTV